MPKNILIFSDGTGQAGGLKPDQRLSNVYKLFRAARPGPDSPIDPSEQVAFYDAGLGTSVDEGTLPVKALRTVRKYLSAGIGFGISRNISDCYEAIIKHYEPGDRVFLFGFSRGAYTVRCVAGVMNLCGIPTRNTNSASCPKFGKSLRAIADEAVQTVYEHGAGWERAKFESEREEKARRFRSRYGSDIDGKANVPPYFIGVFDTVAALGAKGIKRFAINAFIAAIFFGTCALLAMLAELLFGSSMLIAFFVLSLFLGLLLAFPLLRSSLKVIRDYPEQGKTRWHFAGWRSGFYDRYLDKRVGHARHALAIDETRADFARVPWGVKGALVERPSGEPEWLRQVWFAGNHSDIGGSYPEDESRLSDIALQWMVEQASELPDPVILDRSKLHLFPSASGMQHSEVEAVLEMYPSWWPSKWRITWRELPRIKVAEAPLHESVLRRLGLDGASHCGRLMPYRPPTLENDPICARFYSASAACGQEPNPPRK